SVELVLSHPDRRVRADRPEDDVPGNILGSDGVDVVEADLLRVPADEVEGAFVHIDRPDRGVR
ncbi:hypothetical protein ABE10_01855, partial [Bacillus toyonensis]|nr:hypothetical protein [Bacillus toyonensis]